MSSKAEKLSSLTGLSYERITAESLRELFRKVLNAGMHGIGSCTYTEGQKPVEIITKK